MLVGHFILLGKLFQKTAVNVSNSLFPYRTVLLRFGTSDVVDADRNVLAGVYTNEVNRTCMKALANEANDKSSASLIATYSDWETATLKATAGLSILWGLIYIQMADMTTLECIYACLPDNMLFFSKHPYYSYFNSC